MSKKIVKRVAIGIAAYVLFAVAVVELYPQDPKTMEWEDREQFNKVQVNKLQVGTDRKVIIELLGSPDISEARKINDKIVQVMFYRTQHTKSDGITTQDECTPLLFENDKLIAWGNGTYQQYIDM
ncbi:DUF3192 domain-containing protein [Alteromonadaceae bacterium BrNp21-10]|nr:DUF3192 domain-containing protein [Alteromonadaceae bacterium BrNp21-10]